jgi:hypothetical protein
LFALVSRVRSAASGEEVLAGGRCADLVSFVRPCAGTSEHHRSTNGSPDRGRQPFHNPGRPRLGLGCDLESETNYLRQYLARLRRKAQGQPFTGQNREPAPLVDLYRRRAPAVAPESVDPPYRRS